jgi:hypothetical protein
MKRPLPGPLRALSTGYKTTSYYYATELVLLSRKWVIVLAGLWLGSAYWLLLVCVLLHILLWAIIVHWKPFATYQSHMHARRTQLLLVCFVVSPLILT